MNGATGPMLSQWWGWGNAYLSYTHCPIAPYHSDRGSAPLRPMSAPCPMSVGDR